MTTLVTAIMIKLYKWGHMLIACILLTYYGVHICTFYAVCCLGATCEVKLETQLQSIGKYSL